MKSSQNIPTVSFWIKVQDHWNITQDHKQSKVPHLRYIRIKTHLNCYSFTHSLYTDISLTPSSLYCWHFFTHIFFTYYKLFFNSYRAPRNYGNIFIESKIYEAGLSVIKVVEDVIKCLNWTNLIIVKMERLKSLFKCKVYYKIIHLYHHHILNIFTVPSLL